MYGLPPAATLKNIIKSLSLRVSRPFDKLIKPLKSFKKKFYHLGRKWSGPGGERRESLPASQRAIAQIARKSSVLQKKYITHAPQRMENAQSTE